LGARGLMAQVLSIPILPGIRQDTDRTMLPAGSIVAASGVRLRRGAIAKANGLVNAGVTAAAGDFSGPCDALGYAAGRQVAIMNGRAWAREGIGDTWVETGRASRARPVKAHWSAFTDTSSGGVLQPALAIVGDYVATAHYDGAGVQLAIMDATSGIRRASAFYTDRDIPRIFVVGTTFVLVMRDIGGSNVYYRTINGTTLAVSSEAFVGNLQTATDVFDAAPFSSTQWLFARRNGATSFTVALWSLSAEVATQSVTVANNEVTACCVYGTAGENIFATWSQAAANVQQLAGFAPDLSSATLAVLTLTTSASATPAVMTRRDATSVWVLHEQILSAPTRIRLVVAAYDEATGVVGGTGAVAWHVRAASRPWSGSTTQINLWVHTDGGTAAWAVQRRYTLLTLSMDSDVPDSFGVFIEPELAPDERSNEQQSFHVPEVAFRSHTNENGFSAQRAYFPALTTIRTQNASSSGVSALVLYEWETEAGFDARARQVAELGGQGVVFGGGLQELPSARLNAAGIDALARGVENGFVFAPAILSATAVAGANLTSGAVYQFCVVYEYITPDGLRVRSAPSNIVAVTPSGGNLAVRLEIATAPTSEREFSSPPNATAAHVYATVGNGSTFQRVTPDSGLAVGRGTSSVGFITYTHDATDASVRDNEPMYTEQGGVANQPAPAHRFGWAGGGYAWVGGLFNPQLVERSKLVVPNEPVQFTRDNTHRCLLPEACTGGAWLDNLSVVFTRTGIYIVPPTLGAPQRLPSTVGCIDYRSIVELPEGIGFQSRRGYELLPRGFGEPKLISGGVQGELRGRRVISATVTGHGGSDFSDPARDGERLLVLVAIDPALATDPGVRLVLDLDSGRWLSSDPAMAASGAIGEYVTTWDGRLVVASRSGTTIRVEDPTDWGSVEETQVSVTLADLRPFGVMARGNVRRIQLLAEMRAPSAVSSELYVDGSYSKPTELGEQDFETDEPGDKVLAEWEMPERDVNAVGLKFTVASTEGAPNEGLVFHALGLEGEGVNGRPRPRGEMRA
jgi:hypothetical protein